MKSQLISTIFLLLVTSCFSQALLPESAKVKIAFDKLALNNTDKKLIVSYIASFPSDSKTFLIVFNSPKFDQLYPGSYAYLEALGLCATNFPDLVIGKCISIGKNLTWDADAVNYLQHLSVSLATNIRLSLLISIRA